ncbi:unnamed protein product [Musa textilis]
MTEYVGIGAVRTQGLTSGKWIDADDGITIQRFCKSMDLLLMYAKDG